MIDYMLNNTKLIQYLVKKVDAMYNTMTPASSAAMLTAVGVLDEEGKLTDNYHEKNVVEEYNKNTFIRKPLIKFNNGYWKVYGGKLTNPHVSYGRTIQEAWFNYQLFIEDNASCWCSTNKPNLIAKILGQCSDKR